MRRYFLLVVCLCLASLLRAQNKLELISPNGELKVSLNLSDKIYYSIDYNGDVLLKDNSLQLTLRNQVLGQNPKLRRQKRTSVDEQLTPIVPLKYSKVNNRYNQLLLTFKDYSVEFRAFDDGVAYRFITSQKGDVEVMNEEFAINFPSDYLLHLQQPGGFHTAYEEPYTHVQSNAWKPEERIAVLPVLIDTQKDYKILISESDLADYPCMFLKGTGTNGAISVFPKAPLAFAENSDRSVKITQEADYIAKTKGTRNYPWRYFVISKNDKQLIENTMTYKLAEKNQLQNVSWIKPGQVSWEWWNDASPYGPDVNFVSGYNLDTYKYYIDFASKFGIPYTKKPVIFKGIYKYTPGDNYVDGSDKKNVLEHLEIVDECSIMAVLYEAVDSEGKEVILTGHDIASSEYRVAVAVLEDGGAKAEWTTFELPFNNLDGKSYDMSKSYKLAIVCSSSKDGAAFKGAVNSTLIIDELEVIGE